MDWKLKRPLGVIRDRGKPAATQPCLLRRRKLKTNPEYSSPSQVARHDPGRPRERGAPLPLAFIVEPDVAPASSTFNNGGYGSLLFVERPAPCARTYANQSVEDSREVALIAEAARQGHIR